RLPLLGHRVPPHQANLSRQLVLLHQVPDDPLRLAAALLVPGVEEEVGAVPGDDDAAAEALSRLVVELKLMQALAEGLALLLLVEGPLDAPLVSVPGRVVHRPNSIS